MFDCETCVVAETVDDLSSENTAAWRLFHRLCSRFLSDTHATAVALAKYTEGQDVEEFSDTMTRLAILYDVYFPPKVARDGA